MCLGEGRRGRGRRPGERMVVAPQTQEQGSGPDQEQGEGQCPPSTRAVSSGNAADSAVHRLSAASPNARARRRRMPAVVARPAPANKATASQRRSSLREWAAPPNPVSGDPTGTIVANAPVDPPTPAAAPVTPVTPEPAPVAAPVPAAGLPAAGTPVAGVVGVVVPPAPATGTVVVVVGAAATRLLVKVVAHVTVLPPPFDEPLHWLTVIGSAVVAPVTLHCTLRLAPPPVPEPLHCVTTAFVVLATGAQSRVGWVPPPVPEPMHWLTVTPDVAAPVGTVSTTATLHVRLLPPPTMMPLHWSTDVTSWFDVVTVVVQPEGGVTPAAARHAVPVTVEEVAPAALTVSSMVMVQVTW
jgi:hypothetical protein